MEEYNRYVMIAGGDDVKLARMMEIKSWFHNQWELAKVAMVVSSNLKPSEKATILPEGVARDHIEVLLWAMKQIDSADPVVRRRWWEYRSKIEHPEGPGSSIQLPVPLMFHTVPFARVSFQSAEPVASSSTVPKWKRSKAIDATTLLRRSPGSLAVLLVSQGVGLRSRNRRGVLR